MEGVSLYFALKKAKEKKESVGAIGSRRAIVLIYDGARAPNVLRAFAAQCSSVYGKPAGCKKYLFSETP